MTIGGFSRSKISIAEVPLCAFNTGPISMGKDSSNSATNVFTQVSSSTNRQGVLRGVRFSIDTKNVAGFLRNRSKDRVEIALQG